MGQGPRGVTRPRDLAARRGRWGISMRSAGRGAEGIQASQGRPVPRSSESVSVGRSSAPPSPVRCSSAGLAGARAGHGMAQHRDAVRPLIFCTPGDAATKAFTTSSCPSIVAEKIVGLAPLAVAGTPRSRDCRRAKAAPSARIPSRRSPSRNWPSRASAGGIRALLHPGHIPVGDRDHLLDQLGVLGWKGCAHAAGGGGGGPALLQGARRRATGKGQRPRGES